MVGDRPYPPGTNDDDAAIAVAILVERYQSAVYRYLLAAVRDRTRPTELFQEFALRLARGGFCRQIPRRVDSATT